MKIIGITEDARNLGDVLRQVSEMKGLIKDDFVLIRGDIVSNIDLRPAIKMHYEVREMQEKAEKNLQALAELRKFKTIFTKVFVRMAQNNPLRDPNTDITLLMDG